MNSLLLTKEEQIKILELSRDWYIVFEFNGDEVKTIYQNKVCREFCGDILKNNICEVFSGLKEKILNVYKTKELVFIPEFIIEDKEVIKILDIQIYAINGHVILCARDLDHIIYSLRTNAAIIAKKLDEILINKKGINVEQYR